MSRTELVEMADRGVCIEVEVEGERPSVLLVPSAQRGAADFSRLGADLLAAGFASVAVNPRGTGRSTGRLEGLTLRDVADDLAGVVGAVCDGPAHLVGHALGNVFARATAAYRPEAVRSVALLACGGHAPAHVAPDPELLVHFERCSRPGVPDAERRESLQVVFFAPGNDPSAWLDGWWPGADVRSVFDTSVPEEWALAGTAEVLVLQPLEDRLCPVEIGRGLALRLGPRARYVEVDHCGHAILPEQPEVVAKEVVAWLGAR